MRKLILALSIVVSCQLHAQQSLSKQEQKIIDLVNARIPQNLELLKNLVNTNSGTLNISGVKQVGAQLRSEFDKIGFTTEWINLPDSLKRAGHLVAYRKGKKGKKIFLIGHLDTVFEPDMPANPYHLLNDSTATGQGVNDMKGGDVIIVAALQALEELGLLKNTSITAYFTGDEENAGRPDSISRSDFIRRARQHEIALAYEGAQGLNTVTTARRGASNWQLKVYGRQAHSSGIFKDGYGAIYEAARIINAFREQLGSEQYLTFNPGLIAGGSDLNYDSANIRASIIGKTNIISPAAAVQGDLRFLRETQKDSARMKMMAIATTNNLPETRAVFTYSDGIPSMEPTPGNNQLADKVSDISIALGWGPTVAGDPGSRGAGDISYIGKYLDCIDGLGAMGHGSHAPGETIDLNTFPKLVQRTALLIYRLTR
ncbi:MAG TPA: M20/M25/M40 family metallo-hydrolase [Flavisolibacter sp.]|nr:M20/M25/M40 family metallo-hydrolase [Flavisolibacter sp.]